MRIADIYPGSIGNRDMENEKDTANTHKKALRETDETGVECSKIRHSVLPCSSHFPVGIPHCVCHSAMRCADLSGPEPE